jgi:hypothetical protein
LLALSGEDGGNEFRVGMASPPKVADNGINVKRRTALGDGQGIAVILKQKPAGGAAGTRHASAAGIEGADAVNKTIGGEMSVATDDHIGAASGKQRPEFLIGNAGLDPRAVVGPGRRMNAQDGRSAWHLETQLRWEAGQAGEQAGLVKDAAGPADSGGHGGEALHQVDTSGRIGGGRMRGGLLTRQDIAVSVPAQRADARQALQKLKHLGGARAQQDQVAQCPPAVHLQTGRIIQHRPQRYVVSVDISDDSQPHARKLTRGGELATCLRKGAWLANPLTANGPPEVSPWRRHYPRLCQQRDAPE